VEYAPQGRGATQPAAFGHHVEGVVAGLQVGACRLKPDPLHEPCRALADLGSEHPGEVAHAHRRSGGERGQPVVTAGRGLDAILYGPDGGALGPGHPDRRGELGLAARPRLPSDAAASPALANTSCGPTTSIGCTPSKATNTTAGLLTIPLSLWRTDGVNDTYPTDSAIARS
jgi:hypothetical protein